MPSPSPAALVTLLTDFGLADEYVGVMRGVLLSLAPDLPVVDLGHGIEPQNVLQAGLVLAASFRYFPPGTLHVAVVDPGVGTDRRILAGRAGGHVFLAPDNGLLEPVADAAPFEELRSVQRPDWYRHPVTRTFHGRDIFAPVAARLARNPRLADVGPALPPEGMVRLPAWRPAPGPDGALVGRVVSADRFGNLLTTISRADLEKFLKSGITSAFRCRVNGRSAPGPVAGYAGVPAGAALALVGSRDYLELSVNLGDARAFFGAKVGDAVTVEPLAG